MKIKKKSLERIVFIVLCLVLFVWNIKYIREMDLPFALDDELGYWANAAFFAGHDWSGTVSNILYYNWGYSLLLMPLFWIFNSTFVMRKAAILINVIMLVLSFGILYKLCKKIFHNISPYVIMGACFLTVMYPEFQVQCNMTMSEIFISFLVICLSYSMYMLIENKGIIYGIFSIVCTCFLYFTHQRNLGMLICVMIIFFILTLNKKISKKFMLFSVAIFGCALWMNEVIKDYLQTNLWVNGIYVSINDFSGTSQGLSDIFTLSGIWKFFGTLCGQLLYLIDASYGLFAVALMCIFAQAWQVMKYQKKKKEKLLLDCEWYIYLILLFLGTYGISTIFMRGIGRYDNLIYGRYNEPLLLLFLAFGVLYLFNRKTKKQQIMLSAATIGLMWILTGIVQYFYWTTEFKHNYYNYYCAVSLTIYPTPENGFAMYIATIVATIGMLIILAGVLLKNKIIYAAAITVLCLNYNNISNKYINGTLINGVWGSQQYPVRYQVTSYLENVPDDIDVYFLLNESAFNNMPKAYYQFLLYERNIYCVTFEELQNVCEDHYVIIGDEYNQTDEFTERYAVCDGQVYVYRLKNK